MTVLLGFTSLAVDYASLTNERSKLQNAADAAADSKDSIDTTSTGTTGRRATATNYKIVTPKTAE